MLMLEWFLGLVPNEGQFPMATGEEEALLSTGPMCRYADDLVPMLKVMAGNPSSLLGAPVNSSYVWILHELIL